MKKYSYPVFRVYVADELNQKLLFIASVISTSFARALPGLMR